MNSYLLNLPLGVKIPVKTKSHPVFCRGKVGEKLNGPCPSFNLDDPYMYQPSLKYNCLHDPHLRDYHKRKDILRLLKRQGSVTRDNKVVCTLKEFNEYREYLTRIKLQSDKISGQKKAKLKDGPKLPGTTDTSHQAERWPQSRKSSFTCLQKSKETPLKSETFRKEKEDLDKGQTYSIAEFQKKLEKTANSFFKAVFEQLTTAEAQKLQELIEIIIYKVFARLKIPQDQRITFLKKVAQGIRGSIFSSCMRAEPEEEPLDRCQEMEMAAKELLAMVLESLGEFLQAKASESGRTARQKEQPVDEGATQADIIKEAETERTHVCLDKLTRQVVKNVHCILTTMVAFQFEGDSSCEYNEILEFPQGKVSNRQMQPGISGASEEQGQEESTGGKPPPLGPQLQAEGTGNAKPMEPEDPATLKESLVREVNPTTSDNTSDAKTTANQIVQSVLGQICKCLAVPTTEENFQ
ncbi:uncharacterized protein LOC111938377 isoform X2 [Cyanistes caeruleus]|uniref:uncharacterized protein LOC111938377 isoform X2 n=1 Tax=Cyanistes caeruleus TaxID=156563 RepID=UPI000CDA28FF|nr:uncharacterized protein LOC111938377 isoform X2 [Cyanistes caeruleus]